MVNFLFNKFFFKLKKINESVIFISICLYISFVWIIGNIKNN